MAARMPQHLGDEKSQGETQPPPDAGYDGQQAAYRQGAVPALRDAEDNGDAWLEQGHGDGGGRRLELLSSGVSVEGGTAWGIDLAGADDVREEMPIDSAKGVRTQLCAALDLLLILISLPLLCQLLSSLTLDMEVSIDRCRCRRRM
jgi:hypothetical protein